MKNNSIKEIKDVIISANSVLIFPHVTMDGDALGSSVALCRVLREMGKEAHILIEDDVPAYLKFMEYGLCTLDQDIIKEPDLCVAVDCATTERFVKRSDKFFSGKTKVCIDHHKTAEYFADFNLIDADAAATAELIYKIIKEMNVQIDKITGEAIYTGIVSDTGSFQYTNTSVQSHMITVELFEIGIDHGYVGRMIYQNNRIEKFSIAGKVFATLKPIADGKAAIAYVTQDMLKEAGALMEDTEGTSELLRNIAGIEVGIFAKEVSKNETKFSMRSEAWADVAEITLQFGGGGHTKAAGCTIKKPIFEALAMVEEAVIKYFERNKR